MDFDELLRRQDGVVARWQALRYMSKGALLHKTTSGRWRRLHRGVFLTQTGPISPSQRNWLAVLAALVDQRGTACLAGLSALCAWGLRGIDSRVIHVLVPHPSRVRPPPGVVIHRSRVPLDLNITVRPPATLPARSLLDAVRWARSDREATLFIAASFQQSIVTLPDIIRAVEATPNVKRRALLMRTARDCASGSHSLAELDLLDLCRDFALPTPTRQVRRRDRQGRLRFFDALFEEWRVAIEVDGAHHLDVDQMWADAEKANSLELEGYTVLRYPAHVVRTQPARVAAEIREALVKAGWGV